MFNNHSADKYEYQLDFSNHEMFNSVLLYHTEKEVLKWCEEYGYKLLGFTKAPYSHHIFEDFNLAMVVEDENFQIWWFHVSEDTIKEWRDGNE